MEAIEIFRKVILMIAGLSNEKIINEDQYGIIIERIQPIYAEMDGLKDKEGKCEKELIEFLKRVFDDLELNYTNKWIKTLICKHYKINKT